ncbi:MAG: hypothetical protein HRT71_05250 [Flavobacteriales bacterium]|nr:hypothetical protein [Flavobacteriales bacterium]
MRFVGIGVLGLGVMVLMMSGLMGMESNTMLGVGGGACILGGILHVVLNKLEDKKS